MISAFYRHHSRRILWLVVGTFPLLAVLAETIPSNNDIETWLPRGSDVRRDYERFKQEFGNEEVVLIGVSGPDAEDPLLDALSARIERLPEIRQCWSPNRLAAVMRDMGASDSEVSRRLKDLVVADDKSLAGLVALLSDEGLTRRAATVDAIRREVEYCQLDFADVHLAGSPVVIAELDRLGSRKNNKRFFLITLVISLGLLYYVLRQWKLALSLLGLTIWAIQLNLALVNLAGGEMNFIMGALSVMVMVFTLAIAIHVFHYYRSSLNEADPLGAALRLACKPCCLATLTTTIGLVSLTVSDFGPVRQFGYAAALGSLAALITGLGLTPAVLTVIPYRSAAAGNVHSRFAVFANWLLDRSKTVAVLAGTIVAVTGVGLWGLSSRIDPLDFLPKNGKVFADIMRIERDLTSSNSIEAVVELSDRDQPFLEKLDRVRRLEATLAEHPAVRHTMSAATFFPVQFPDDPLETAGLLRRAQAQQGNSGFVTDGQRLWRISARIKEDAEYTTEQILNDLTAATAGAPITFTGIGPLLDNAQRKIFEGFWESFATAFLIITVVMIVSLRSFKAGAVAMVPNLTPICIVFGVLGWVGMPVDIGMMMTGSIALGIAVDGTFHFLVRYEERYAKRKDSPSAARVALLQTGAPILEAAVIAAVGMLALTLSNFTPTARFGYMMATLLLAALVGDLVLLPALLSLRPKTAPQSPAESNRAPVPAPKMLRRTARKTQADALASKSDRKQSAWV